MQEFIDLLKESNFDITEKQIIIPLEEFEALENKSLEYPSLLSNEYTNTLNQGYFDKECIYTKILYKAFWSILEQHESSAKHFRAIRDISTIYSKSNDLLTPIYKNQEVIDYLNKRSKGKFSSYNKYKSYLFDKYGFNIDEYMIYKNSDDFDITIKLVSEPELQKYKSYRNVEQINNLKYVKFFRQENDGNFIASCFKKGEDTLKFDAHFLDDNKDTLEEDTHFLNYNKDIQKDIYEHNNKDTSYLPYYKYPKLRALEINNVNFQFSILDDNLDDLIKELKSIYKAEKVNSRNQLGSIGKLLFSKNQPKYQSAKILVYASLIYYYRNKCTNYDDAFLLYSFHMLIQHKKDFKIKDEDTIILKHDNVLTNNTRQGEVRKQIRQIISILNLD